MPFKNLKQKYSAGKIHFIGIGGIGMSAIAKILNEIGCKVQGSDLCQNANTKLLEELGVECFEGHDQKNISDDVVLVVETSIVKSTNPEIIAAKSKNIPIIRRADMLAQIMNEKKGITVAGTHGKTSTTAMIAVLLESLGSDPMVINGGIINNFASNAKFGKGEFLVAESDESDASFVDLPSFIGVVNNIEPEHMDFYGGDFELVKKYYQQYVSQIPKNGLVAICIDDVETANLYQNSIKNQNNIVTLSIRDESADYFGFNISINSSGTKFDVRIKKTGQIIKDVKILSYGLHNVKNALAPIAIGHFLGFDFDKIKQGLEKCTGVKRRFTKTGEVDGISIIDDYGHHPTEISAVFNSAKNIVNGNKLIAVFQPHKYSRTKDMFGEFCNSFKDVDIAIIAQTYTVGQDPILGARQDDLIAGIKNSGHKNVLKLNSENDLPKMIKDIAKSGDMVLCIGAGSISNWANDLPEKLKAIL